MIARSVRFLGGIASRFRNVWFRLLGVRIQGLVWMRGIEIPRDHGAVRLIGPCALDRGVVLLCSGEPAEAPKITINRDAYINRHVFIDAAGRIEIGRGVAIGPFTYITDHDHGTAGGGSVLAQPLVVRPVRIGDGAWIGAHCSILKGVTVGEGAVIGAGSVVTRDIPPNAVAAGNPARILRVR